jgi:hypothetical protein
MQEGNALQLQYHGGYGALRKTLHGALPGSGNGIAPVVPDLIGVLGTSERKVRLSHCK